MRHLFRNLTAVRSQRDLRIIIFKAGDKAFFVYGFAKNKKANINNKELKALKKLADQLLSYTDKDLSKAVENAVFEEVIL